jgi:hypothetical protein
VKKILPEHKPLYIKIKIKIKLKIMVKIKINKTTDSLIIHTQTLAQKGRRGTQRKPFQPGASENETNHLLH